MSNTSTIARPYAKAAFATALQDKTVTAWSVLLNTAKTVVCDSQMAILLKNPRITPKQRFECLTDICATVMHEPGRNFFKLLANQDRLLVLPEIAELFEAYRIEQERITNVEVISATKLGATEQERLAKALKIRLQREVSLEYQIDPSLIGGSIIRAGDLVIDGSVRGKLARLSIALAA